jgi:hypothetical protein
MLSRYLSTHAKYSSRKESGNIQALSMQAGVFGAADILFSTLLWHFAIVITHKTKKD